MDNILSFTDIKKYSLDHLISTLHDICVSYDPKSNVSDFIYSKIDSKNIMLFGTLNDFEVSSLVILEKQQNSYGTLTIFSIDPSNYQHLVLFLTQQKYFKNFVFELIHFRDDHYINDLFIQAGLLEKPRQRMIFSIPDSFESTTIPSNLHFESISKDNIDIVGLVSSSAHKIRHGIEGYSDFFEPQNRASMELILLESTYFPYSHDCSYLLKCNDDYAGSCSCVVMDGWNLEQIIWIMDFSIKPEYQGFGYARYFLNYITSQAKSSGYTQIGLGVTISNKAAVKLYESFGFVFKEYFVEFLSR